MDDFQVAHAVSRMASPEHWKREDQNKHLGIEGHCPPPDVGIYTAIQCYKKFLESEGFVIVPDGATRGMRNAGADAEAWHDGGAPLTLRDIGAYLTGFGGHTVAERVYSAMISAHLDDIADDG